MIPQYLQKGDFIGICAPARFITEKDINPAIEILENRGYKIILSPNIYVTENQFAGNDTVRANGVQYLIDNSSIKAILCARGGYGCARIVNMIDYRNFIKRPKWLCGYSDFTVFLSHIFKNFQLPAIHSTMPINMKEQAINEPFSIDSLISTLEGNDIKYTTAPHELNRQGCATGKLVGGNLSVIYSLLNSPSEIVFNDTILFIEDLDEYLYHIDRMFFNLKISGKLAFLKGLIVGGMTQMHDNNILFGKTAEEIIYSHCKEYNFPVMFVFPSGHQLKNLAVKMGYNTTIEVTNSGGSFVQLANN